MNSYSTDNTDIDDAGLLEYAASLGYGISPATQSPIRMFRAIVMKSIRMNIQRCASVS